MVIFRKPPQEAVPSFNALALERTRQLATYTFSQPSFRSDDFRQIPSSQASISQLVMRTFLLSVISMPSLFQEGCTAHFNAVDGYIGATAVILNPH